MTPSTSAPRRDWSRYFQRIAAEAAASPSYALANEAYRQSAEAPSEVDGFARVRIGILRNVTVEPWLPELFVGLLRRRVKADFVVGDFGVYEPYALDPSQLGQPEPDYFFLYFDPVTLAGDARHDPPADLHRVLAERMGNVADSLVRRTAGMVILSNLGPDPLTFHRLHADQDPGSWLQCRRAVNEALVQALGDEPRASILDMDRVIGEFGLSRAHDTRMFLSARNPFSVEFLPRLAAALGDIVATDALPPRKCIVVDCDNTLWGGVLGEDGPERVAIGPEYPGEAYRQFQLFLQGLRRRGILLALNSKNDEADVLSFMDRSPDMLLRPADFAAHRINWRDKAQNLRDLAEEMNIGLDAMIFVDDSPVECERVGTAFPEVQVERFPANPSDIPGFLESLQGTGRLWVTDDDRKRGESMRARSARENLLRDAPDFESFLRSLDIRLEVVRQNRSAVDRISQLARRTNQFNLTTRRYGPTDIERLMSEGVVYTMSMEDRFVDYGIIAVAIVRPATGSVWEIDSFLLSCRAFGRNVEGQLLDVLLDDAEANGAAVVRGRYLPTAKNGMARNFLPEHGFSTMRGPRSECRFELSLPRAQSDQPSEPPSAAARAAEIEDPGENGIYRVSRVGFER